MFVEQKKRYFNCTFEHFMCLIKSAIVGEKNFDVIKMHGTTIEKKQIYSV
jgi:hypothetical protein